MINIRIIAFRSALNRVGSVVAYIFKVGLELFYSEFITFTPYQNIDHRIELSLNVSCLAKSLILYLEIDRCIGFRGTPIGQKQTC